MVADRSVGIKSLMLVLLFLGAMLQVPAKESKKESKTAAQIGPSENKGRKGQYTCPAVPGGYHYIVIVPESYSEKNPAGLFLYLCHAGDLGTNVKYAIVKRLHQAFVEPFNLIGIFVEPKPAVAANLDADVKALTAEHAIAQIVADYDIVVGRGLVYSTGGGGGAHRVLLERGGGVPGKKYPFCSNTLNSCRFSPTGVTDGRMNWYLNLGEKELYLPPSSTSWKTMSSRWEQLVKGAVSGGCVDIYFMIHLGNGHTSGPPVNNPAVEAFKRADVAFAPFLCQSQFDAVGIASAVDLANEHQFARALKALGPEKNESADTETRRKTPGIVLPGFGAGGGRGRGADFNRQAQQIRAAIAKKIREKEEFARKIMKQDPVVGIYYLEQFKKDCAGTTAAKTFEKMLAEARKNPDNQKRLALFGEFCTRYPDLYEAASGSPNGHVRQTELEFFRKLRDAFGEESNLGRMVRERLEMTERTEAKPVSPAKKGK